MRRRLSAFLIALALIAAPRPVFAAWAIDVAWSSSFNAGAGINTSFTYGSAVAAGATLICFVTGNHATQGIVTGASDDVNGGAWTKFGPTVNSGGLALALTAWYFPNSAAGTPTVTATFTLSVSARSMACGSYTGLATSSTFDVGAGQGQTNPGTASNAISTGATAATAQANELAVAYTMVQNGTTITAGTTLAWTQRLNTSVGATYQLQVEDFNVASPATVTATWTINNAGGDTMSIVGTFKEPSAGGGCTGGFLLLGVGKC